MFLTPGHFFTTNSSVLPQLQSPFQLENSSLMPTTASNNQTTLDQQKPDSESVCSNERSNSRSEHGFDRKPSTSTNSEKSSTPSSSADQNRESTSPPYKISLPPLPPIFMQNLCQQTRNTEKSDHNEEHHSEYFFGIYERLYLIVFTSFVYRQIVGETTAFSAEKMEPKILFSAESIVSHACNKILAYSDRIQKSQPA